MVPQYSIVIPVYRTEQYLDTCIQSLRGQSFSDIEVILVDDGSPDSCPALCDAYAAQDSRFKAIHKTNGGLSDARNAGIRAASGEYILFLDSDDYIAADTCERLLPFVEKKADIIVGDGVSIGARKNLAHRLYDHDSIFTGEAYLKAALKSGSMPMASWLYVYRRMFLEEHDLRFETGILHEDEEFTPRAFLAAETVVDSGICFYYYVIREGSITTQKDLRKNAGDLYRTCKMLSARYLQLTDSDLQQHLLDSLVVKYLSLFQQGRLYQYGQEYIHKDFVQKYSYLPKTRLKARIFSFSPKLYWAINDAVKRMRGI